MDIRLSCLCLTLLYRHASMAQDGPVAPPALAILFHGPPRWGKGRSKTHQVDCVYGTPLGLAGRFCPCLETERSLAF